MEFQRHAMDSRCVAYSVLDDGGMIGTERVLHGAGEEGRKPTDGQVFMVQSTGVDLLLDQSLGLRHGGQHPRTTILISVGCHCKRGKTDM